MNHRYRLIGVLLVLSLLFIVSQVSASCLLYTEDESKFCVDFANVGNNCGGQDCEQFSSPQACSDLPQCKVVQCTVDCADHTKGFCEQLGGTEVQDEFEECGPACCRVERANSCSMVESKFQCEQKAVQFGLEKRNSFFDSSIIDEATCLGRCGGHSSAVVPGASSGSGVLDVTVSGADSRSGITVFARGPMSKSGTTDDFGVARIENLAAGSYQVSASKIGFRSDPKIVSIVDAQTGTVAIELSAIEIRGISGTVFYDKNEDGVGSSGDGPLNEQALGAKVYLNDVFKGVANGDAYYQIQTDSLTAGDHIIKSSIEIDGVTYSAEKTITVEEGGVTNFPNTHLLLLRQTPECGPGGGEAKNVDTFTANPVLGEKSVRLTWVKPCKEVTSYRITKEPLGPKEEEIPNMDAAVGTFVDSDVLWDTEYTYTIVAVYSAGPSEQSSANPVEASITLGNSRCEGKYHADTNWERFCIADDPATAGRESKFTFTCGSQNEIIADACPEDSERSGSRFFCAPSSPRTATCKDAGPCSLPLNNPFSLYYNQNTCLGITGDLRIEGVTNFCYFDYSPSIVEACNSCENVRSCFEYKSKGACELNTCLTDVCTWVPGASNVDERGSEFIDYSELFDGLIPTTVSPETGAGYCAPATYAKDDHCSDCSALSTLFEGYYCTAQVCSSLGRCFSNPVGFPFGPALTSCASCGEKSNVDINCYSYTSRLECTGSGESNSEGILRNDQGELTYSDDQCGWERCKWLSSQDAGQFCVKDGDSNGAGDCESFVAGDREACVADTDSPITTGPTGLMIISSVQPNLTVQSVDLEATLDRLSVCTVSSQAGETTPCTIFSDIAFSGRLRDETIRIPVVTLGETVGLLTDEKIAGENYKVVYYALDKFHNQEQPKSTLVYVDTQEPLFDIENTVETVADTSSVEITLVPQVDNGKNRCTVEMKSIIPRGEKLTNEIGFDVSPKVTSFPNLKGISYLANVTCADEFGNVGSVVKAIITNPDQEITIVSPEIDALLASPVVTFEVGTTVGSFCKLNYDNAYVADFVTDEEGKRHVIENQVVPGQFENASVTVPYYSVICQEFLTQREHAAAFGFIIDGLGPSTLVTLREGHRELEKGRSNWKENFIRAASVEFECRSDGFECASTQFCVGDDCQFEVYSSPFSVEKTNRICYFSNDTEGHSEAPKCGEIVVDGFGITLENPEPYTFDEEIWGVSDQSEFEWRFSTRVPTVECRYDFRPNFEYESVPRAHTLYPTPERKYVVGEFPTDAGISAYDAEGSVKQLYVKCKNNEEELSPEQKFNLEYDPSAPSILSFGSVPELLLEGTQVVLHVETDDKTTCKFNDISEGSYDTMRFSFPGTEERVLNLTHSVSFDVNTFVGLFHDFALAVQCRNGAGLLSQVEVITFRVDYSALGAIESVSPDGGYFTVAELPLEVQTSKSAVCDYRLNDSFIALEGAFSRQHIAQLTQLSEGEQRFPIRCQMGDHLAEALSAFIIDRTPPTVTDLNDGNLTCGRSPVSLLATTTDAQVVSYYYEVYDLGLQRLPTITRNPGSGVGGVVGGNNTGVGSGSGNGPILSGGQLILNATTTPVMPIEIPTDIFNVSDNESRKIYVKLRATDAAGLSGPFGVSDGVLVVGQNFSVCRDDTHPPEVRLFINDTESCSRVLSSFTCSDITGCFNVTYGESTSEKSCKANITYTGQKIPLSRASTLCYAVEDNVGNKAKGTFSVPFADTDGDGILNRCDNCTETKLGAVAALNGCGSNDILPGDKEKDTDTDGLYDWFEKKYTSCGLDYLKLDTDKDSVKDADEDPDSDGRTNLEEMFSETDPCTRDKPNIKPIFNPEDRKDSENKDNTTTDPKKKSGPKPPVEDGSIVPLVVLVIGLVLFLSGIGYLIYEYKQSGGRDSGRGDSRGGSSSSSGSENDDGNSGLMSGVVDSVKDAFSGFDKWKTAKSKDSSRKNVFDAFHSKSSSIPHVGPLITSKSNTVDTLQKVAQKYVDHKDEIAPGLRREEKGVFAKLESIAKKSGSDSAAPVDKSDAKDILGKLRDISKNRKKGA